MAQKYLIRLGDEEVSLELDRRGESIFVRREGNGRWCACELERVGDSGLYLLMIDNRPTELYIDRRRGGAVVTIGRHIFNLDVGPWRPPGRRARAGREASGLARVTAPMTGSIVEVRCEPGEGVSAGQVVLVIESMKMNNELRSPATGVVETVAVVPGQRVRANDLLVAIRAS